MPSHGEVGAHEWPVTAGTDRPVAIGTRTVDNWTEKPSTETGPRCWGPGYTAISAPRTCVGSCSRGATPESGGDCPDEARKRAVGPTWIARRWGSPSEAARRRGFRLRYQRSRPGRTPARRAHRIRVRDDSTPTATTWRLSGRFLILPVPRRVHLRGCFEVLRDAMRSPACDGPIDSDSKRVRCRERFCRRPLIEGVPREEGCCCRGRGGRVVGRFRGCGSGRAALGRVGRVRPREGVEVGAAGRRQRSPSHAPHVTWSARSRARHTAPSRST